MTNGRPTNYEVGPWDDEWYTLSLKLFYFKAIQFCKNIIYILKIHVIIFLNILQYWLLVFWFTFFDWPIVRSAVVLISTPLSLSISEARKPIWQHFEWRSLITSAWVAGHPSKSFQLQMMFNFNVDIQVHILYTMRQLSLI